ncbi:MAG: rRNA maturation RNase YbeY [Bacteroidales bacterium]|jgi:probable rRNA maturation factor|nr:rRNA maturation RNase YbeY [Bacteroidales bacterium]
MPIKFFVEETKFNLKNRIRIKTWIRETIIGENLKPGVINFIFTSDKFLLEVNKQYLSHDYFTDIITFNYCDKNEINGDIYISISTVKNNSISFNVTFIEELHRVMIHGILHLMNYNDKTDQEKAEIRKKENYYLERFKKLS